MDQVPRPGELITLDRRRSHHLLRVLRLPRGESVELFDGAGGRCEAELIDMAEDEAVLRVAGGRADAPASPPRELVLALTRKPAWELALRMATELGVTSVLPFAAQRSVALSDHLDRWQRILESAAAQCGRADLPRILPQRPLAEQLLLCTAPTRIVLSPGAPCLDPGDERGVSLLIGPEGGLTGEEEALALAASFVRAGLGQWVLRADTAAVAALARYGLPTPRSTR